jgi:hypothetical protein
MEVGRGFERWRVVVVVEGGEGAEDTRQGRTIKCTPTAPKPNEAVLR